jgi:hypothetical protein
MLRGRRLPKQYKISVRKLTTPSLVLLFYECGARRPYKVSWNFIKWFKSQQHTSEYKDIKITAYFIYRYFIILFCSDCIWFMPCISTWGRFLRKEHWLSIWRHKCFTSSSLLPPAPCGSFLSQKRTHKFAITEKGQYLRTTRNSNTCAAVWRKANNVLTRASHVKNVWSSTSTRLHGVVPPHKCMFRNTVLDWELQTAECLHVILEVPISHLLPVVHWQICL